MRPVIVRDQDELRAVIRQRVAELNTTFDAVNALSGLPDGYLAKLLAPVRLKKFGSQSLPLVLHALALKMVKVTLVEDLDQAAKLKTRWTPRRRRRSVQRCVVACSKQDDLFANSEDPASWQQRKSD